MDLITSVRTVLLTGLLSSLFIACGGGSSTSGPGTGNNPPVPLFGSVSIRDASTANCTFANPRNVVVDSVNIDVVDVSYSSWEYINGQGLMPIIIRGYLAKPASLSSNIPAVVYAHGLGGSADESTAAMLANNIHAYVLAYSGPGAGQGGVASSQSEGLPSDNNNGYRLFDTLEDVRGSWIWGYTVAAMRGLTCLENRSDVDASRLGVSGISVGGIATLLAASLDDRVIAAVPASASLALDQAVLSPNAWEHALLADAGLDVNSKEWTELLNGMGLKGGQSKKPGAVYMINGSSDGMFPLQAHSDTYRSFSSSDRRISLVGNFDHGCLAVIGLPGIDAAADIQARALLRIAGGQRAWFQHRFATNSHFAVIPSTPTLSLIDAGLVTAVVANVDSSASLLDVEEVRVWASADMGLTFLSTTLTNNGDGTYSELVPVPRSSIDVAFVDVQYKSQDVVNPDRFSVSSEPITPQDFVQHVLDSTCAI